MSSENIVPEFQNDHNVYILGAGFSYEAGYPLVPNFMEKMREAASWQKDHSQETKEIEAVLKFRLEAASAAYRVNFDPENVEDLFSLTAATETSTNIANRNMVIAIAETLDYCRYNSKTERKLIFPGAGQSPPKGFERDNPANPTNLTIDRFKFYVGHMVGVWGETPYRDNTFITFNYDLLLEEALQKWEIPFRYDGLHGTPMVKYDQSAKELEENANLEDVVFLLKLHGSMNWSLDQLPKPNHIFYDFKDVPIRSYQAGGAQELLLAPPVWDKGTARIGHPLSGIWSNAIRKIQTATRIIVIGYSLPLADAHFRYLMAAGLQNNISLREIVFVNPAFRGGDSGKEADKKALEERVFSVFKRDLHKKGILKLLPFTTYEFFFPFVAKEINTDDILGRKYPLPFR
ncbi:MAG: hypothetical protein D084_Lepto4C00437G0005 [Leptospirillum sp. Group IV 'UBA BS']|nr:MAG: hypothetical protein D084_Lepto4C00437G0005 [Leptospirillum sp. Group IV 'UBA BS']